MQGQYNTKSNDPIYSFKGIKKCFSSEKEPNSKPFTGVAWTSINYNGVCWQLKQSLWTASATQSNTSTQAGYYFLPPLSCDELEHPKKMTAAQAVNPILRRTFKAKFSYQLNQLRIFILQSTLQLHCDKETTTNHSNTARTHLESDSSIHS